MLFCVPQKTTNSLRNSPFLHKMCQCYYWTFYYFTKCEMIWLSWFWDVEFSFLFGNFSQHVLSCFDHILSQKCLALEASQENLFAGSYAFMSSKGSFHMYWYLCYKNCSFLVCVRDFLYWSSESVFIALAMILFLLISVGASTNAPDSAILAASESFSTLLCSSSCITVNAHWRYIAIAIRYVAIFLATMT